MTSHFEHLTEKIDQAEARLVDLREQAGAALLDGGQGPMQEIAELENFISRLRDAQGIARRREREDEVREAAEIGGRLKLQLSELEEARCLAVAKAEAGLRQFVEGVNQVLDISKAMIDTGSRARVDVPSQLAEPATVARLGLLASAILGTIKRNPRNLGHVSWSGSYRLPTDSWADLERKELSVALSLATRTKEPENNGNERTDETENA